VIWKGNDGMEFNIGGAARSASDGIDVYGSGVGHVMFFILWAKLRDMGGALINLGGWMRWDGGMLQMHLLSGDWGLCICMYGWEVIVGWGIGLGMGDV